MTSSNRVEGKVLESFVACDLTALEPRAAYALLTQVIQPRPIAFASTISADGVLNLAPFSFFMAGGSNPPSVCFSPTLSSGGIEKDTLRNIRETGEFVINSVHRAMAEGMNATSATLPPSESEWEVSGFTPIPSEIVKPPRVAESLVQMECRLFQIFEHGHGPTAARYIVGEVLRIHVRQDIWQDGKIDTANFHTLARLGGPDYLDTDGSTTFAINRPR